MLTAYTTLSAQLATARAERDALRERVHRATAILDDYVKAPCVSELLGEEVENCTCFVHGIRWAHAALATPARPTDTGRDG